MSRHLGLGHIVDKRELIDAAKHVRPDQEEQLAIQKAQILSMQRLITDQSKEIEELKVVRELNNEELIDVERSRHDLSQANNELT